VTEKKPSVAYLILEKIIWLIYPKLKLVGEENIPEGPVVLVGNHCQMNGPIASQLYIPGSSTWCAGEMMELKEVPSYAFKDFWSEKPLWCRWFYKILSYIIAPLCVLIFNNANTIAVYHDSRLRGTLRQSMDALNAGRRLVIFPEHSVEYNHIVYDFQGGFIDLARLYSRQSGKVINFVPVYIAPRLKEIHFGRPIPFDANASFPQEKERIRLKLMESITDIACDLPEHTVVPYRNLPRRLYKSNKSGDNHEEKTRT